MTTFSQERLREMNIKVVLKALQVAKESRVIYKVLSDVGIAELDKAILEFEAYESCMDAADNKLSKSEREAVLINSMVVLEQGNQLYYDVYGAAARKNENQLSFEQYAAEVRKHEICYGECLTDSLLEISYGFIDDLWHDNEASDSNFPDGTFRKVTHAMRRQYELDDEVVACVNNFVDDLGNIGTGDERLTELLMAISDYVNKPPY